MHDFVTRRVFRRSLQEQHRQGAEDGDGDPIVDSFQFRFPVPDSGRYLASCNPAPKAALSAMDSGRRK